MTVNQTTYIFIDESGTLPDPNNRYVVFAAVASESPETLSQLTRTIRKKIAERKRKETLTEIKFYRSGDRTKKEFLWELSLSQTKKTSLNRRKRPSK